MRLCRPASLHTTRQTLSQRRWLATPATNVDPSKLPLAGVKVLDMTRVLAGVSGSFVETWDGHHLSTL